MKHLLEKLKKEVDDCEEDHDKACGALSSHVHYDPAMVHMWQVMSANTELLVALAEAMHRHLEMHHCGGAMPMGGYKNIGG